MKNINEIKDILNSQILDICQELLPNGRKNGNEWEVGGANGEAGKSLRVHLLGNKAGIWSDFATGASGDVLDLFCIVRGQNFKDAAVWASERVYGHVPELGIGKKKYHRPRKPSCHAPKDSGYRYLRENRKITDEVIERYKIGESGNQIYFPFIKENELILCKVREAKDGAKPKPTEKDCEKILFGWQAIDPNSRYIVITEGEIDALSGCVYGLPTLSVPFGGGSGKKQDWIESEYDNLQLYEEIYLALDSDKAGQEAVAEISTRLGLERCKIVKLPHKDLNECLQKGVTKEEIDQCIKRADTIKPEGLKHSDEFIQDVIDLIYPQDNVEQGYTLPFKGYEDKVLFRPSELTLWSGKTSSGKSQALSHSAVDWIEQGGKVCIASFEMAAKQLLRRMMRQTVNQRWDEDNPQSTRPTEEIIKAAFRFWKDHIYIYDKVGKSDVKQTLEIFTYARKRYGCDIFVVDSLMRLGVGSEDYDGQEKAVYELVNWAVANEAHVHLVAHSRKGGNEKGQSTVPELDDVKGAQEIAANAFNVITLWRNKNLEDSIDAEDNPIIKDELSRQNGVLMNVAKQRNGDWSGKIPLWFNRGSYQYRSRQDLQTGKQYVSME